MKTRVLKMLAGMLLCSGLLTSCYVYKVEVGEGAKGNQEVQKWNSYIIYGLVPIEVSNPKDMAGGAKDYTVIVKHSFVNGLVTGITFGIYSPTTTVVKK
jgi:hypothetical protein